MGERRPSGDLCSYANVNGEEAVGRRGREERTRLERISDRGEEWHMDILALRRFCRVHLDRQGAHVFARFYWGIMANQENMFRNP